ncbi:putative disease resistance RPP13-like protein 3 [Lolium rigidum]|uniref:putative disease resistance RPP13-like protein 3 n=1 Tax=Lolium rigidum TaxID=89674 RepID=UPI001F5D48A2|nr:putative disease resistance RPP13-like protein 3 [Lolium rigidum]
MSITTWRPSSAISSTAEKLDDFVLPLVGREAQLADLGSALISDETKRPMVISVTGKSGVGKTKLVKERYEKSSTKRYFEVKAWVTCAPNLSASNIMKLILLRLVEGPLRCPKEKLGEMLRKELENHRYLLVIDGEVNSTEWSYMLDFLPTDIAESRVVRITQATNLEPPPASFEPKDIALDHFEEQNTSVNLFLATLFMDDKEKHCGSVIEEAVKGKHAQFIFNVTGGLPLAIVLLSGLLRTKEYPGEWEKVFKHLEGKSSESKRLDNILSMCFDDLPHDLKSCFLYFAGFPASTLVKARSLVCKWMAEGFLRPKEGKTMEKVGERYLHELIHRRLMNLPPLENAAPGDERVTVQTKVHDFLVLEAQEANFVEIHHGDDLPTLSTARRLSLQNHTDKYAALADPLPKLRSIMSNFEKEEPQGSTETREDSSRTHDGAACSPFSRKADSSEVMRKLLKGSRFLCVIYLDGLEIGNKLPSEIGSVVHLHYLGITSCSLGEIPASVGKLTRLQTLDVRGTDVSRLPSEFWKIRTLRHVFGSIVLPRRVGNLEQLQTLQAVKPDDDGGSWDATTFTSMKRLQFLYISGLTARNAHALVPVYALKYLVLLSISGDEISLDLFARSNYTRLQVMVLKGKTLSPSDWSKRFYFPSLTKLSLKNTKVSQEFIDKLSQELPLLASLALFRESLEGKCLSLTDGFQSLKELKLDVDVLEIIIMGQACPNLEKMELSIYSWDLNLQVRPEIADIIRLQDKFLYANVKRSKDVQLL